MNAKRSGSSYTVTAEEVAHGTAIEVAASTMLGQMVATTLDLAKELREPWQKMPEAEQERWLFSATERCTQLVRGCVRTIAAEGHETVIAEVESVTFKDGVKVVMKLPASEGAHTIADQTGKTVLIVADTAEEELMHSSAGAPEPEPDQRAMELEEGADGDA